MNEQPFLKTLVSFGAMVLIFIGIWSGHWVKFYPWSLITSDMDEKTLNGLTLIQERVYLLYYMP